MRNCTFYIVVGISVLVVVVEDFVVVAVVDKYEDWIVVAVVEDEDLVVVAVVDIVEIDPVVITRK